jgi:hypothetical protein
MDTIPLFTMGELRSAFELILPEDAADRWAKEWFARFGDPESVDSNGYFLYMDWSTTGSREQHQGEVADLASDPVALNLGWLTSVATMSPDQKAEDLLMRFSDLHLYLLILVSPTLEARVQLVYRDPPERAKRRRRIAAALAEALRTS